MVGLFPQRLYLMQLAAADVPLPTGQNLAMVNVCYLIVMSDGKHILIDTGLPAGYHAPGLPPFENPVNVLEQLDMLGLKPTDIDLVICTHFDVDHAGYHDCFTNAEFVVQRRHYDLARSGHPRYADARSHWDNAALRYRLVDGDVEILPGVTLVETSGHALGHQSVLVRLPRTGTILLAIDAVILGRLFTPERTASKVDDNEEQLRASTQKLLDMVKQEEVALIVFGHDGEQWRALKKSPEFYQ